MRFEVGKAYQHVSSRQMMMIVGRVITVGYGECLVGERIDRADLIPVGYNDDAYAENWDEIPLSQWYKKWIDSGNEKSSELKILYNDAIKYEKGYGDGEEEKNSREGVGSCKAGPG